MLRLGILATICLAGASIHAEELPRQDGARITEKYSYPNSKKMIYFLKDIHNNQQCIEENRGTLISLIENYNVKLLGLEGFEDEFDANMEMMFPLEQRASFKSKTIQRAPYFSLEFDYKNKVFTVGIDDMSLHARGSEPFRKLQKYCRKQGSRDINLSDTLNSKELKDAYHEMMAVKADIIEERSKTSVKKIIKYMKKLKIDTVAHVWGGGHWESVKKALEDYNKNVQSSEKISYIAVEVPSYTSYKSKEK